MTAKRLLRHIVGFFRGYNDSFERVCRRWRWVDSVAMGATIGAMIVFFLITTPLHLPFVIFGYFLDD